MRRSDFYRDEKKGLWRKQVTIGGKRKVFSAKTKKEVLLKIMQYQQETSHPSLNSIADQWEEEHWQNLRQGSLRSYNAPLRRIREKFGGCEIDKISPRDVQNYLSLLGQTYSAKSVSQHKSILNMIYNYAIVNLGMDIQNPTTLAKLPTGLRKTTRSSLSLEERKIVADPDQSFLLPLLIYYTGTRCGEALAIQFKDVDFKDNTIAITKAIHHEGNRPVVGDLKTVNSYRVIPLLSPLKKALLRRDYSADDYLVSGESPLTKSALSKRWKKWQKETGLSIDRHTIRHCYASILYEAGIEPKSAQMLLGHADIRTTMNIYTHLSDEQRERDFEKLEKFLQ